MQTQVSSLTVEELKILIKETMSETFSSLLIEHDLVDPDAGKQIRPEFAARLRESLQRTKAGERGKPLADVAEELGVEL